MNAGPVDVPERTLEVPMFEAIRYTTAPLWYSFTLPFVGAAGIIVGSRLRMPKANAPPAT